MGKKVLTISGKIASVWDSLSGEKITTLEHEDDIWDAYFSPAGSEILTLTHARKPKLWNADSGSETTLLAD